MQSLTSTSRGTRQAKTHSKRRAIARLMEALETRTMLSTTAWLSVPTAELRQPSANAATQISLQDFPPATVTSNGSLQYTTSWVANSYGGYDVMSPNGLAQTYNMVNISSMGVAAGPQASDGTYLMGFENGYAEEGDNLRIYQDGAALPLGDSNGSGGGRGVVFGDSHAPYVFESMNNHDKDTGNEYYSVGRFDLSGHAANFTTGIGAGQNYFGVNALSGQENYIFSNAAGGWQPTSLGYFYNTATSTPTLYVSDNLDNSVYMFNAVTGAPISTAGVNGVILNPASSGNQTVTVSDGTHSTQSGNINVLKTAITTASLGSGTVTYATAGTAFNFTVTALKSDGSVDTGYVGTVSFTSSDGQAALPANYTFVAGDNGIHTFSVTLKTAGQQTITATDSTNGLQAITTTPITVTGASAAASFSVNTVSSIEKSNALIYTLTAKDAYGNAALGYTGTVHFTSTDGTATLPADYTFKTTDKGVYAITSGMKFGSTGSFTVTATDTVNGTLTKTTNPITVVAVDTTYSYQITGVPSQTTAGTSFNITVTALKADGVTTDTTNTRTIQLTTTDPWINSHGGLPSHALVAGTYTFSVTLDTAGSQTITATDTTDQGDTTTTSPITVVNTGSVDHLAINTPTIAHAGSPFNVTVSALDLYNNPVTSYTGTVSFTASAGSNPSLPAAYTFIAADHGVRQFISGTLAISDPYDMAFDNNGYLWVANSTGGVQQYNASTGALTGKSISGLPAAKNAIAWDSQRTQSCIGGELAIAISGPVDASAAPIRFWDVSGTPTQTGTFGSSVFSGTAGEMGVSKLSNIVDIDFDAAGKLYVATASHNGFASAEVRVIALSGSSSNPTGTLSYAEIGRTAGASATAAVNPSTGADEMYTLDSQLSMNYNAAPGDQWTWTGLTYQPGLYGADTRNLSNIASAANTPLVRYINGAKYMYLVGAGNYLEVYKQDTSSYLFRPVAMISMQKGDIIGDGTGSFEHNLEPTDAMWVWTDANGNGDFDSGEFTKYTGTGAVAWVTGLGDVFVDNSGNLFFSVGKAYGDSSYGPAIVTMSPKNWNNGVPTYDFSDNSHTLRALLPTNDNNLLSGCAAWGQTSGKANNAGYIAYDQANDILYMAGGPDDGEGGLGTVLRAYKNWSTISYTNGLGDLTNYNNDPNHLAWSINPGWINLNDSTKAMHVITAAGGYVFVESRGDMNYAYFGAGSQAGTLAGEIQHATMTTINAFPDNAPPFQAIQRTNGDIILTSEGFYTEPLYRILAAGNHSPTASFSQDVQSSASAPVTVTFKATASDVDGDTLTYNWQFGDGTFDHTNSPTVTHTYTYNGGFKVDLVVGDNKGGYADVVSTVTVGPATTSFTNVAASADDAVIFDTDTTGDGAGVCDSISSGGSVGNIGGNSNGTSSYCAVFPFDLWANGLRPGDHVSTTTLPALTFVLSSINGSPAGADLYAVAMENTIESTMDNYGWMYYAGSGDTSSSAVMLQQNFLTSSSPVGTRIGINPAAALALANYINAALDAGNRFIVLRLSPQTVAASTNYYSVNMSDSGANAPQLSVTTMALATVSNTSNYSVVNNALAAGLSQYGNSVDSGVTFTTIPAKYLGSSYIRTDNGDKATSTTNGNTLQFSINQTATVYVAYDDALAGHQPSWLTSGFTDTGDNIVTTAGTFSVYKSNSNYAPGLVSLGANTSDGNSSGHMYSVLVIPTVLQASNLVGWWKFDEGNGTTATDVAPAGTSSDGGTVNTGSHTINGVPVWQDGYQGNAQIFDINLPGSADGPSPVGLAQAGSALHFDGTNYVSITDNGDLHPASNVSVSLWAMNDPWEKGWADRNGWQSTGYLVAGPNFYIQPQLNFTTGSTYPGGAGQSFPDGQQLIFAVNTSGGWKTLTYMVPGNDPTKAGNPYKNNFNLFQWHQYGLSFSTASGGTLTAYVDGVAVKTLTSCGTLTTTSGSIGVGGNGVAGNYFQGTIDDVRIYNSALAASTMQALGNLGVGVSAVDGSPTAKGAANALRVTGVTGMAAAAVTIAPTTNATEGGTTGVFTVTRTGSTASPLSVNYTVGGSAVNGTDCLPLSGTVTIPAGQSSATINVAAIDDHFAELTETVDLTLTGGNGYYVGSPAVAQATIANAAGDTINYLDSSYLKGYWRFDENSGTTANDSAPVTADTATLNYTTAGTLWGAGKIGNAASFLAANKDYVSITDNNGNLHPASLTVGVWAQSTGVNWNKAIDLIGADSAGNNFYIRTTATAQTLTFAIYAGTTFQTVSYTPSIDLTQWHHYAMTYNDSTKVLTGYVDGVSVATKTITGTRPTASNTVTLGKYNTNYFTGSLDEASLYNTALSAADMATLASQVPPQVAVAGVSGTHISAYSQATNALQAGVKLYGDASNTFSTIPSKYLGATLIQTSSLDAASQGLEQLGLAVNGSSIAYVLYDDAITGTHRADATGGWLTSGNGFTDTGDNIVDSSGHTFSVYKVMLSAGTTWLGGNTADGVNGTGLMYGVLVQPLTQTNALSVSTVSSIAAGTAIGGITVTAKNPNGTTATGYTGTVHFTSTDGQAVLPSDYTFVSGDNGVHTFTNAVTLKTAGNQVVTVADTATGTVAGTSGTIAVSPLAATTLNVSTVSSATAGSAFSLTLTAKDTYGNVATGYTGTVHFTSTDGQAVLPANYAFVSGDNGVHTFSSAVTLKTAGNQTVTATDTVTGTINVTTGNINVSAAAASQAVITTQPSSAATAGTAFATQPVVKLEDAYGNVVSDSTHTVTAVSNGSALLQGTLTVTLVNGVATFTNLSYNKAETMTIGFSSNAGGVSSATSGNIVVSAAAASQAVITTQPSGSATAGTAFATQPVVKLEDTYGNVVSDSTHTVTAVSNGSAALQGTTTVTLVNGVATFTNLSYNKAETMTLGFSTNAGSETATSNNVVVSPAAASTLSVSAPGSATAGTPISVTVTALDAYANTATGYTGTVHFTSTDGAASLPSNYAFVSGDQGVHTFTNGVTLNTGGNQTVTATDTVTGTITGTSSTINVTVATSVSIVQTANATEGGGNGTFTVTRTGSTGSALTVNYSIGGSAVNGTDYTSLPGTVTIASGSSTATITVAATNDTVAELTETVDLTITSGTGYNIGSPSAATVNIIDNDTADYQDSANLVGYWRLDENSGTAVNDSAPSGGTADTGTATGANWGTGQIGNAYHANRTSNYYVSVPNSTDLNPTTALSLSVWAKNDSGTTWTSVTAHALASKGNSYQIVPVAGSSNMKFQVRIGGAWYSYTTTTGPADVSQWHHYAMTWDGTTLTGYIDGVAKGTAAASGTITTNTTALLIAADGTGGSGAFTGYVDEVRLYNTALSSGHIANLAGQSALSVTGLTVAGSHGASYSINANALQAGVTLYGDAANTFSTFPGNSPKYLGSTLLKTASADANSVGDKQLGFTLNQNSIVYVLYDDAISGSHRADAAGGWLASGNGFTDTGDNITDSTGHTFSVYKASVSAGTLWLGGNTLDGVNGTGLMYDVLIQPLL